MINLFDCAGQWILLGNSGLEAEREGTEEKLYVCCLVMVMVMPFLLSLSTLLSLSGQHEGAKAINGA